LYYRPAIVGHINDEYTRASCRSIPEFHITDALDQCEDLLEYHGGHAAAAGFTVKNKNLMELIERLRSIAKSKLADLDLRPCLNADLELSFDQLEPEILTYLQWLQPTGYGNREAKFISRDIRTIRSRPVGKDGSHLKLVLSDGWLTYDAIAFRQGHWHDELPPKIDILYAFEENEFRGQTSLQLNIKDIKPAGST
jgi:single-stranded-DNA-specific exonuclease